MYDIYNNCSLIKKNPLAINALKQVFNEYTQILDTSSIPASISIPGLLTCFCLEHKTIRGIQKQTNNIKQKNKTHTHEKKTPHVIQTENTK